MFATCLFFLISSKISLEKTIGTVMTTGHLASISEVFNVSHSFYCFNTAVSTSLVSVKPGSVRAVSKVNSTLFIISSVLKGTFYLVN